MCLNVDLFHQYHFLGGAEFAGFHAEEIQSAGHRPAGIVRAVPGDMMSATVEIAIGQGFYHLAFLVIDVDAGIARGFQAEADGGAGIEGIGALS